MISVFHLSSIDVLSLKENPLTKGRSFSGARPPTLLTLSHFDMAPENAFCIFLSFGKGIPACKNCRNALPAETAMPKFVLRFFVADDCFTSSGIERAM